MTTTSFKKAFKYDASGYFEHELSVQVVDGDALMPPSCTLVAPVSTGGMDASKFYRFDGKTWIAEAKRAVRSKRDALLSESDYYLQPDYPATEEGLKAVKAYRTDLRNVPQQTGFPYDVAWPEKPDVLK